MKKILLNGLGFICLGLGAIGAFLPVLPTTPFVLLAVACFSSSPRIRAWIKRSSLFREYIESYEKNKSISKKTFWKSMLWLWSAMIVSMIVIKNVMHSILLMLIGLSVTIYLRWLSNGRRWRA